MREGGLKDQVLKEQCFKGFPLLKLFNQSIRLVSVGNLGWNPTFSRQTNKDVVRGIIAEDIVINAIICTMRCTVIDTSDNVIIINNLNQNHHHNDFSSVQLIMNYDCHDFTRHCVTLIVTYHHQDWFSSLRILESLTINHHHKDR